MPATTKKRTKAQAEVYRKKKIARLLSKTRMNGSNGVSALTRPPRDVGPTSGGFLGQTFDTELSYADYFSMNPTPGGPVSYLFVCNGLFDPNFTGTGHQPYGFDQLMANYAHYQVLSSTIEVVLFPKALLVGAQTTTTTLDPQILGSFMSIAVRDTSEVMTGLLTANHAILERPNVKTVFVNSNSTPTKIRASYSVPMFYGKSKHGTEDSLSGTATSNPSERSFYHVIFGPPDGSTDLESHDFMCRMKFKVRLYNPVDAASS
jgi:hypothetical protein